MDGSAREKGPAGNTSSQESQDSVYQTDDLFKDGARVPILKRLADVSPEPIDWLWPGRIALGKLTLIPGDPGLGKSFLSLDLASRVTRGTKWPDSSDCAPQGSVVLLSAEDDAADTIRPRLDAAGADVSRVFALSAIAGRDADGPYERPPDLGRDIAEIGKAIDTVPDCKLVIVDPISAYMGGADSHKDAEVRSVLAPLATLAAQRKVAVVCVTHLRKGEGQAIHRSMGSVAFAAAARAVWTVVRDRTEEAKRLFLCVKNNLGNDHTGLAFTLTTGLSPGTVPHIEWYSGPVTMSADEAMAPEPRQRGPDPTDRNEAVDFLRTALADGPRLSKELEEEAREGHGIAVKTLKRARKEIGVVAYREEVLGPWWNRLPDSKGADIDDGNPLS